MDVKGKQFLVTGGGNGIGREIVWLLLDKGARVVALDLSADGLAETAAHAASPNLVTFAADITDRESMEALPAEFPALDGLINVAGVIHEFKPIAELSIEDIERVMTINFWGTVYLTKAFLPVLLSRPEATLVNFGSMGGLVPFPGQGAYGASKGAVKLFTDTLLAELRGTSVKPTIVFPGGIATNITGNSGVTNPVAQAEGAQEGAAMKMTPAPVAAQITVEAIEKGTYRVRIGGDATMLDRMVRLVPTKAITVIADKMKAMMQSS